jgi:hypothetical protein
LGPPSTKTGPLPREKRHYYQFNEVAVRISEYCLGHHPRHGSVLLRERRPIQCRLWLPIVLAVAHDCSYLGSGSSEYFYVLATYLTQVQLSHRHNCPYPHSVTVAPGSNTQTLLVVWRRCNDILRQHIEVSYFQVCLIPDYLSRS